MLKAVSPKLNNENPRKSPSHQKGMMVGRAGTLALFGESCMRIQIVLQKCWIE